MIRTRTLLGRPTRSVLGFGKVWVPHSPRARTRRRHQLPWLPLRRCRLYLRQRKQIRLILVLQANRQSSRPHPPLSRLLIPPSPLHPQTSRTEATPTTQPQSHQFLPQRWMKKAKRQQALPSPEKPAHQHHLRPQLRSLRLLRQPTTLTRAPQVQRVCPRRKTLKSPTKLLSGTTTMTSLSIKG